MAKITINIEGDTEGTAILRVLAALSGQTVEHSGEAYTASVGQLAQTVGSAADGGPATRTRRTRKANEPETIGPAAATPDGLAAALSGNAQFGAGPPVDPFATPAPATSASDATAQPATGSTPAPADQSPSAQPAPTAASPSPGGDVTLDMLKQAMTFLLTKTSASAAQAVLKEASGGVSSLTPLKPEQYAAVYAALRRAAE